jgi:4-diphosphocytidyl-2-C-methyl-D-erythritol kinase
LAAKHWHVSADDVAIIAAAKKTGSDTLCCLESKPCYFAGVGDELTPVPNLPHFYMVLVNPHIAMPTPSVFAARTEAFNQAARFETMPDNISDFVEMLAERRNDLQPAAISLCPTIQSVLDAIDAQQGCLLTRLSGSGATCFGLFVGKASADLAATCLKARQPDWWVVATGW